LLLDRCLTIPDDELFTADVFVADWKLCLRSTCIKTTDLYSQRIRSRNPVAPQSATQLTLSLLEASALGWHEFLSRDLRIGFKNFLEASGLEGAYLNPVEPCTIFDSKRLVGAQIVTNIADLPPWHSGAPFRILLHLAAISRGWGLVHGATLAEKGEGVLIVGPGKAGKSGTTLAGISVGLNTVGDDYVLVCPGDPPTAFRVYNLLKQDRRGVARIAGLAKTTAHLETNWQDKLELDPEELFPGCLVEQVRLGALLAPKIAHTAKTQFLAVDPQYVFRQLWPSLWSQLPVAQASGFKFAASLTRALPTFTMLLSDDPSEIGESTRQFIAGLRP
jgi:hypothetical protein